MLVMCGMMLIAVSPLTAAQIMLLLDRFLGAHFFDTQAADRRSYGSTSSGSSAIPKFIFW